MRRGKRSSKFPTIEWRISITRARYRKIEGRFIESSEAIFTLLNGRT